MTTKINIDIANAKTAELVAFYNRHSGRSNPIKKFQDRATAEARVAALIEEIREEEQLKAKHKKAQPVAQETTPVPAAPAAKAVASTGADAVLAEECDDEVAPASKAPRQSSAPRSSAAEAIARSWLDSAVAAKRKQRSAVMVDGVEYKSVRAAYLALDLPLNDHIAFRMQLKEAGKPVVVEGREWVIIPKNY